MTYRLFLFYTIVVFLGQQYHVEATCQPIKIVGLLPVRNEAAIIEQCLRGLAVYTDALVVLDDASHDATVEIIRSLEQELHVERILINNESAWEVGSERDNYQWLLNEGRAVGGTHFIFLGCDELFSSLCAQDDWLRKKIETLPPGYAMTFPMMNVWDGVSYYRDDEFCSPTHWKYREIDCIWCDDPEMNYNDNVAWAPSKTLHVSRMPSNNKGVVNTYNINYGLIHFKCANLDNLRLKKIRYTMLEYIRLCESNPTGDKKGFAQIANEFYKNEFKGINKGEQNIILKRVPDEWYSGYDFFDPSGYVEEVTQRKDDIMRWLQRYDVSYFSDLNIWHFDWMREG